MIVNDPHIHCWQYKLDNNGEPVPCNNTQEWSDWFQKSMNQRILGRTYVTPDIFVSTVFLAFDHGGGIPGEEPILWETMVFRDKKNNGEECARYKSRKEAIEGHLKFVDEVKASLIQTQWPKNTSITIPNNIAVNHCPYCHMIQPDSLGWKVTCTNHTVANCS